MAQMKLIPADNMKDKLWGKRGTPEREAMEAKLKEDVNAYIVGEAIRKARLAQNLTQEQLGERIGCAACSNFKVGERYKCYHIANHESCIPSFGYRNSHS